MKNLKVALAAACAVVVGTTAALGSTWTGKGDGVKWSDSANWDTAPGKNSAIVFTTSAAGATVIDVDFTVDQIGAVTLPANWTGSVTQQKDISVNGQFDMSGGIWKVNGMKFTITGHFYAKGGDFNAASSDFIHSAANYYLHHTGGSFHGGRCCYYKNQNHGVKFANSRFDSLLMASTTGDHGANTMKVEGTAEIDGDLRIEEFTFNNNGGVFKVHGDVIFAKHTKGGPSRVDFVGGGTHNVKFLEPAEPDRLLGGFACSVTDGSTVKVTSDNGRGKLGGRYSNSYFILTNGVFDASAMSELVFSVGGSENSTASRISGADVLKVPQRMTFDGCGQMLMKNLVFKDMGWNLTGNGLIMAACSTNFISGNLYSHGAALWTSSGGGPKSASSLQFRLYGDLYADNDGNPGRGNYAGNGHLVFAGDGDQVIHSTNAVMQLCLIVDKTNGVVKCRTDEKGIHLRCNSTNGSGRDSPGVYVKRGTLDLTNTDVTFDSCSGSSTFWQNVGTTLIVTNTTFTVGGGTLSGGFRITDPIESIVLNLGNDDNNPPYPEDMTTTVTRAFSWSGGRIGSYSAKYKPVCFDLRGDLLVTNVSLGACVEFLFTGTETQHVRWVSNTKPSNGNIVIDKPSGTLVLDSDLDTTLGYYWRTGNRDMIANHRRGRLDLNGHTLTVRGKYEMGSAATVVAGGAGQIVVSKDTTVSGGATVEHKVPQPGEGLQAAVATTGTLTLPNPGIVNLALSGKLTPESPTSIGLFSYGTLKYFDPSEFRLEPHPDVSARYKVVDRTPDKLVVLNYRYKRGLMLLVK